MNNAEIRNVLIQRNNLTDIQKNQWIIAEAEKSMIILVSDAKVTMDHIAAIEKEYALNGYTKIKGLLGFALEKDVRNYLCDTPNWAWQKLRTEKGVRRVTKPYLLKTKSGQLVEIRDGKRINDDQSC